jgi:putative transposase
MWRDESGDDGTAAAVVTTLLAAYPISARRACRLIGLARSRWQYHSRRPPRTELRTRLRALAAARPRWGYQRLHVLLRREGYQVNHKLVYRLYREEGLVVRRRRRKQVAVPRVARPAPSAANARWGMDFIMDAFVEGRRFRCLTMVDEYTRECPVIAVDTSLPSARVIQVLEQLAAGRGLPQSLVVDHGPEFISKALDAWAYAHGVELHFIRPGKPVDNAYIESFHSRFRDECLNESWFWDLPDARQQIEAWRRDYNEVRPHSSLAQRTPKEFTEMLADKAASINRLSA